MVFETDRLILRPWAEVDAESLYEYARDPSVGPIAGWPPHTSVENSLEVIRTVLSEPETYAVCLKDDNRAIGSIGLMLGSATNLNLPDKEGEIGYWIGVPFWGMGLIPEAVRELIRYAFVDLKLDTLWCGYFDGNEKSKRCMEKCGFKYHHTNYDIHWKITDEIRTEHVERLTKDDWINNIYVGKISDDEIPTALNLAWNVFSEFEAPEYEEEGVSEFKKCLSDKEYLNGIEYYGAYCGTKLVGVLGFRKAIDHICFFFVDGKYHRLGIGRKLFDCMLRNIPSQSISLNSSPYGVPFYKALGFIATDIEQTVNGIRFTPMEYRSVKRDYRIVKLSNRRDLKYKAAEWFSSKWRIPEEAYIDSIEDSFNAYVVPSWYLCLDGDKIIAGAGVIDNDFHDRPDLTPNICAVYTEENYRKRRIAGNILEYICEDMHTHGIDTLYLLTDHTGFYERYGWEFYCMARGEGEDKDSRMYIHHNNHKMENQ